MDTYEVVVLVGLKNAVREIVSSTTYDTLERANTALAQIAAAQRREVKWPELPWLAVKGTDVSAAFVRGSERRGARPTDIESLVQRMGEILGIEPAGAGKAGGDDDEAEPAEPPRQPSDQSLSASEAACRAKGHSVGCFSLRFPSSSAAEARELLPGPWVPTLRRVRRLPRPGRRPARGVGWVDDRAARPFGRRAR